MSARDYQIKQIESAVQLVARERKIVIQLPTGGGKTYEFALIAERYCNNTDKSVLILVDRIELMYQAEKTLKDVGIIPRLIDSKTKQFQVARVYIGMVESLISRLDLFQNVGLVIIDECHVANFNKIHNIFLEELIIGVTATPVSSSKKMPLNKYYNGIVVGPQISELINLGYLSNNTTRCPQQIVDRAKLMVDKMTGDFSETQMATEYKMPRMVTNVVHQYEKFCLGKKTMIYNVNKDHSKKVNQALVLMGHNSRHLDSDASESEREEVLNWFKTTKDAILNNVGLFTRGFDEPTIQRIITNFSTLSVAKWLQCTGRGGRIIDQAFIDKYQHLYPYELELKNTFEIIDLGGNAVSGLGDWSDDRDWGFIFNHPEAPGNGVAPTKTCPACEGLIHAAAMTCTLPTPDGGICGYEFVRRKPSKEELQEMVIVKGINFQVDELNYKYQNKYPLYPMFKIAEPIVDTLFDYYNENPNENQISEAFRTYYKIATKWHTETFKGENGEPADISDNDWYIRRAKNNFYRLVNHRKNGEAPYDRATKWYKDEDEKYLDHVKRIVYS